MLPFVLSEVEGQAKSAASGTLWVMRNNATAQLLIV
jgi:hypothetical protein